MVTIVRQQCELSLSPKSYIYLLRKGGQNQMTKKVIDNGVRFTQMYYMS